MGRANIAKYTVIVIKYLLHLSFSALYSREARCWCFIVLMYTSLLLALCFISNSRWGFGGYLLFDCDVWLFVFWVGRFSSCYYIIKP